jgi:hypothetical protein
MNENLRQFSEKLALELKARLASPEVADFVSKTKASGDDRSFEVVFSTGDEDRQGDALDQSKWDLKYYVMNPVVLWAHDYGGFPIGVIDDIKIQGNESVATGHFAPKGMNPDADMACDLYQEKILKAVSPGYIQNDDGTRELLEISFCPVPAGRYALSLRQVGALGVSTRELVTKGFFYETKGAVPYADHGTADEDAAWDGPAEVKACGDDLDKLKAICAWFDSENADVKSSYKLPHHQADGLKAVWKGVSAAGAALSGSRGGVDIPEGDVASVKAHLKKHYEAFGKTPPWEEKSQKAEQVGDKCELDDGTPGVLADDPKNPGHLVCVPERDKSQTNESMNELEKKLKAEHERHGEEVGKHIDGFAEKCLKGEKSEGVLDKAIEEYTKAMDGEQEDHLGKCMKAIDDSYETMGREPNKEGKAAKKSIDEFKAEVTDEHLKHVKACDKAIEEFKAEPGYADDEKKKAIEEFTKSMGDELDRHEKAHEEMCKAEAGRAGEGEDDEKAAKFFASLVAEAVKSGLAEEGGSLDQLSERIVKAIALKAGRAISAANADKIKAIIKTVEDYHEAHATHTEDVTAALKAIIASGDGGEEPPKEPKDGESDGDKGTALNSRSSTSGAKAELEGYLLGQRLVRQVKTASEDALRVFKKKIAETTSRGR